ncbi:MAG: hypothetical protein HYT37_02265 [Candidatus Sungbacteria bacterium]|nr:hypothetical protein [Candidatus Sungbacteria bacterium]
MSKNQLSYTIQKELLALNDRIERKIIKNKPYSKEASIHKALLRQLHHLNQTERRNKIVKIFSLLKYRSV